MLRKILGLCLVVVMAVVSVQTIFADNKSEGNSINTNSSVTDDNYNTEKIDVSEQERGLSYNSINKTLRLYPGDCSDEVYLEIRPTKQVNRFDTITLKLEGGTFWKPEPWIDYEYAFGENEEPYGWLEQEFYERIEVFGRTPEEAFKAVFYDMMNKEQSTAFPYDVKIVSDTERKFELFPIPEAYVGKKFADVDVPLYRIPIPVKQDCFDDIYLTVITDNTSISGGVYNISKVIREGTCGENIKWNINSGNDTEEYYAMTIDGNGEIGTFDNKDVRSRCYFINIRDGITSIADNAFASLGKHRYINIVIPESVKSIGDDAFKNFPEWSTILCHKGSYAEKYAKEKGINYEYIKNVSGIGNVTFLLKRN